MKVKCIDNFGREGEIFIGQYYTVIEEFLDSDGPKYRLQGFPSGFAFFTRRFVADDRCPQCGGTH
jgi:hypothetical protein